MYYHSSLIILYDCTNIEIKDIIHHHRNIYLIIPVSS